MPRGVVLLSLLLALIGLSRACHPECRWQCDDPVCKAECRPVCKKPVCAISCENEEDARRCTSPHCWTKCPTDQCESESCPACETQCSRSFFCPNSRATCQIVCEAPQCAWECTKPLNCLKPKCQLQCERPACEATDDFTEPPAPTWPLFMVLGILSVVVLVLLLLVRIL